MLVKNLRTIDINRIVNRFNINIIDSSTIEFVDNKSRNESDKFKEYIISISDKAEIVDEVI